MSEKSCETCKRFTGSICLYYGHLDPTFSHEYCDDYEPKDDEFEEAKAEACNFLAERCRHMNGIERKEGEEDE